MAGKAGGLLEEKKEEFTIEKDWQRIGGREEEEEKDEAKSE